MSKYSVCAAYDVSVYIHLEIEADTFEDALKKLKAMDADNSLWEGGDVDYGSADEHRIVEIVDAHESVLVESLYLTDDEWEEIPVTPIT